MILPRISKEVYQIFLDCQREYPDHPLFQNAIAYSNVHRTLDDLSWILSLTPEEINHLCSNSGQRPLKTLMSEDWYKFWMDREDFSSILVSCLDWSDWLKFIDTPQYLALFDLEFEYWQKF